MQHNLSKEEHPRFQRAQDARHAQTDANMVDFSKMTDEEITRETEEYLRKHPEDGGPESQGAVPAKRKSENDGGKQGKEQRTSASMEEGESGERNGEKRGLQADESLVKKDKRIRLGASEETGREQLTLEKLQRESNISSVRKSARKQARNVVYDVKSCGASADKQVVEIDKHIARCKQVS